MAGEAESTVNVHRIHRMLFRLAKTTGTHSADGGIWHLFVSLESEHWLGDVLACTMEDEKMSATGRHGCKVYLQNLS